MVFSLTEPARESYLLWHRFTMPTASGTRDAVAVTARVGDQLISAYTFLLDHIVLLVWGIAVVIGVLVALKRNGHNHPRSPIYVEIYSKRTSPYTILQMTATRFLRVKSTRWFVFMWIVVSFGCLTVKYAIPIIFAGYIKIGNAAPVNPSAIFVPSRNGTDSFSDSADKTNLKIFDYYVPSALRAVGSVESLNATGDLSPSLSVDQPKTIGVDESGGLILRIGYRYNVTGLDFGLQDFPDLVFSVEGSCTTEYSWWGGESSDVPFYPGAYVEQYLPFNNPNIAQFVSLYDGGPRAFFFASPPDITPTNSTWAAVISSVNRTSWFPSTDPWYQTIPNPFYENNQATIGPYMVAPRRPVLSCWENDVWSYNGHSGSVTDLPQMPGLNLPPGLMTIFVDSLGVPMIYLLGTYLQVSALKSSITALSNILDASSSSIHGDLERLVYASYIATVNCLTETTLFSSSNGFLNDISPGGVILPGTENFVIYGEDIATLSVRTLIIIPTVAIALWIVSISIFFLPITQQTLQSLNESGEVSDEEGGGSKATKIAGVLFTGVLGATKNEMG